MVNNFADVMNEWIESVEVKMDDIFQTVVIKVGERVVRLSPVDTGLFRGNWQLTIDAEQSDVIQRLDTSGNAAITAIASKANNLTAGQVAYILNHIEYGYDLEYGTYYGPTAKVTEDGFSRQAPEGMVRVTEAEFIPIVNEAVRLNI